MNMHEEYQYESNDLKIKIRLDPEFVERDLRERGQLDGLSAEAVAELVEKTVQNSRPLSRIEVTRIT